MATKYNQANNNQPNGRWLSILTYNIQQPLIGGLFHQIFGIHTEKSFLCTECLPHATANIGADIIVFTEAFIGSLRHRLLKLMSQYGYKWSSPVVNHCTDKHCNGGVVIISRYPIVRVKHYEFKASSNVDGLAAKGVLYAEIDKHGFRYHLLATHLNAFYDHRDSAKVARRWQIMELRQFYSELNIPRTEPVFVAGDLNIDNQTREHGVMLDLLKTVQPKIQSPTQSTSAQSTSAQYTINIKDNEWARGGLKNVWLDYILYFKYHLKPSKAINQMIPLKWNDRDLSDHYPVLGLFQFT